MPGATVDLTIPTVDLYYLGVRWARLLKSLYPGRLPRSLDAKACARDFLVSVRTAHAWSRGRPPHVLHLHRAIRLHGRALVLSVIDGADDDLRIEERAAVARLRLTALEQDIARIKAGL